ncbi:HNH endonuclease family protein [Pseudofrankia saprophytica]|uniref:HNH endonuclease family protein n=1 Tax=Pseudofrankia saprophytica TaxID=298655 RepID=UPI000234BAB8|nr:HNH endonuclease family protein [Pseudofrankia saprophytica]
MSKLVSRRMSVAAAALVTSVVAAMLLTSCDGVQQAVDSLSSPTPTPAAGPATGGAAGDGSALAVLATLQVQPLSTEKKYDRDEFGTAWKDVDHNSCDTRNDILHRDLRSVTVGKNDDCIVLSGELSDPYTNRIIRFNRGRDSSAVQIDHVVALADAWRTGAYAWTDDVREAFANDPQNLLAVDGPTNIDKSDQDASEWLPPAKGYQCSYVARQVGLKARYHLWVTQAEADAMRGVLSTCPSQPELGE